MEDSGSSRLVTRPETSLAPSDSARDRRKESSASRRSMAMNSLGLRVLPKSTERFDGEKMRMRVTWRSMR